MKHSITKRLSNPVEKQIEYKLKYHFPFIQEIEFKEDEIQIILNSNDELKEKEIQDYLVNIIEKLNFISGDGEMDKTIFSAKGNYFPIDQDELSDFERTIIQSGLGTNIYMEESLEIINSIKDLMRDISIELKCKNISVPSTLSVKVLDELDYITAFYHHLSFCCHLNPSLTNMSEFEKKWHIIKPTEEDKGINNKSQIFNYLETPNRVLNPALCLHIYPLLKNSIIENGSLLFTTEGHCFRNESGNHNSFHRLFEYSIREIIEFSDEDTINKSFIKSIYMFKSIAELMDLKYRLVTSNDIFFGEKSEIIYLQLSNATKIEFELYLPNEDKYIAVGSSNRHKNHFSSIMNINLKNNKNCHSMCYGIGFERFAYALFSQKGKKWKTVFEKNNSYEVLSKTQMDLSKADRSLFFS